MLKDKKIFITGGAGFIASRIIGQLVDTNEIKVFDNFHRDTLTSSGLMGHKNLKVFKGDVLDSAALSREMAGFDYVIHAAGIAGIDTVVKDSVKTMRVNMLGTANVLQAAFENNVSGRILSFSTSEVFGSMAFRSDENDNTVSGSAGEARWTYAVSKLAGEHLAHSYGRQHGLPITTVRPFNVYGPGQTGEGAMHIFIRKALSGETIEIDGDGSQIRAWCFVEDFIQCIFECLTRDQAVGESFNIGNPRAVTTILGLANTVCRVLNSKSKIEHLPPLSADIAIRIPSTEKATKLLGFSAGVDLEEGILRTAEWILKGDA